MKAIILAAGLGTRLRPLTDSYAKPALPVLGVPGLWYSLWSLKKNISELTKNNLAINVSHAPQSIRNALQDAAIQKNFETEVHISDESNKLLGSSGALWKLKSWIGSEEFLVTNADSITNVDWTKLVEFHHLKKSKMTLHVREFQSHHETYSQIVSDANGKVTSIGPRVDKGVMFSGCYIAEASVIDELPQGYSDLKPALLDKLVERGELYSYREDGPWLDLGNIASYMQANVELLQHIPQFRELVEFKMKELEAGVWVEKNSSKTNLKLNPFVVLNGDLSAWEKLSKSFGPWFIGIEPSNTKLIQRKDLICLGETQCLTK